ncbi:MAG: 2OG-Fe(II) oxygenase family protein [Alphaproteobacteria bacterium]
MIVALNPALDVGAIAQSFRDHGRVHIPGILTPQSATHVHRCLEQQTDYLLFAKGGDRNGLAPVAQLSPQQQGAMMAEAYAGARDKFHFLYDVHPMSNTGEPYPDPAHPLSQVTAFLNSAAVLDFARAVTGSSAIAYASAQATRYRPGQFLNQHDDGDGRGAQKRIAAYVLNMTPQWRLDWGGALLFSDRPGHIAEGFPPAFNALNLFSAPQEHLVGFVAPFAGAARYSITGWFTAL